jgi:hypothetical protein
MATLADTDPVVVALRHLRADPAVLALLDGDAERVRGDNVPPYPRVRLLPAPGDDRDLLWLIAPGVQVEALGDLDGSPGPAALRRLLYTCTMSLRRLPDLPPVDGLTVVTNVAVSSPGGFVPLPNTQPRWLSTVQMHLHPRAE